MQKRLRRDERTSNIPILITALGGLKIKFGFNSGADDGFQPFIWKEYVYNEALLRTKENKAQFYNQQEILNYGPLTLVPEDLKLYGLVSLTNAP